MQSWGLFAGQLLKIYSTYGQSDHMFKIKDFPGFFLFSIFNSIFKSVFDALKG